MNNINFSQTGGFPLDTNLLDFMQKSYQILQVFGELAGNYSILQGCKQTGSTVSDGVVYINGEVLPFKGSSGSNVVIKTEKRALQFEDGNNNEVEEIRYATFGVSSTSYKWVKFKRPLNLFQIEETTKDLDKKDKDLGEADSELLKRLKKLEDKVAKIVPLGLVAIWRRPANEIPEGWQECTDMRGRVPVGYDVNYTSGADEIDYRLNEKGYAGGKREHQLTVEEMPKHRHKIMAGAGFTFYPEDQYQDKL